MKELSVRWGILGAANIARKNWKAILNSGNGRLVGVASRDPSRAGEFIRSCQSQAPFPEVPKVFGSYEEMLESPGVEAVYIPLPTGVRAEWVKRAAAAGKHVICEKPCAISVRGMEEMLEACRRNNVQFMDGVMFMHGLRWERMAKVLRKGDAVGEVRRITSAFSFCGDEEFFRSNMRAQSEMEPAGCLGDLGWYCIRFSLWVMNWQMPREVSGRLLAERRHPGSGRPVPTEFSGELFFDKGVTSSFHCSFLAGDEQWARISGTRGQLYLPDFVLPFAGARTVFETATPVFEVQGCDFRMLPNRREHEVVEDSHGTASAQESRMFRDFARQVLSGELNQAWPDMALKTQQVMERLQQAVER